MKTKLLYAAMCALVLAVMLPITAMGQRRWVVVRPHRSRVVVYNYQRPYVVYQQPYYSNQYYSYRYSQPYFANRDTYSWANPTYRYDYGDYGYYRRPRHNRVRIWFR